MYVCKYAPAPERNRLRRSEAKADERVVVIAEHTTQTRRTKGLKQFQNHTLSFLFLYALCDNNIITLWSGRCSLGSTCARTMKKWKNINRQLLNHNENNALSRHLCVLPYYRIVAGSSLPEWAGCGTALFQVRNERPCSFEESAE